MPSREMPCVEIIGIRIVLAHVGEARRASMFDEGFRCGISRVVVVEVEANLFEAQVIEIGQGTTPQIGGVQDDDRAFRLEDLLERQVGQEIHKALEDLKQASLWPIVNRDVLSRTYEALELRVTGLEARPSRVT